MRANPLQPKTLFIHLVVILLLIGGASAQGKTEEVSAVLSSYDYDVSFDWGFSYSPADYWEPEESKKPLDFSYIGLTEKNVRSILEMPSQWRKCWFRIDVSPSWKKVYDETIESLSGVTWGPLKNNTLYLRNAQAYYEYANEDDDFMIFPKPELVYSAYSNWLRTENMVKGTYWEGKTPSDASTWILEALILVGNANDEEIHEKLTYCQLSFDALLYENEELYSQNITLSLDNPVRKTLYLEGGYTAQAVSCEQFSPFDGGIGLDDYDLSQLEKSVYEELENNPSDFKWYKMNIEVKKEMPWAVISPRGRLLDVSEYMWLINNNGNNDFFLTANDQWYDGQESFNETIILLRAANRTDEEITEMFQSLDYFIEFSTEFAGEMLWTREGRIGYVGRRFMTSVDMSEVSVKH